MISANIMGRLGNQMFQIAAAESLALENNDNTIYSTKVTGACPTHEERTLYTSTVFKKIKYVSAIPNNVNPQWTVWKEKTFSHEAIQYKKNIFIDGYFQSEKYFNKNKGYIRDLFSLPSWFTSNLKYFYGDLSVFESNDLVAVHVRRGDYVKLSDVHSNLAQNHGYYETAMKEFPSKKFVFFSDDINWCKTHFGKDHLYINSVSDLSDMLLIGLIPNKIIANSSFSWWAAWLHEQPNHKIIAPQRWFENNTPVHDLLPSRWLKI